MSFSTAVRGANAAPSAQAAKVDPSADIDSIFEAINAESADFLTAPAATGFSSQPTFAQPAFAQPSAPPVGRQLPGSVTSATTAPAGSTVVQPSAPPAVRVTSSTVTPTSLSPARVAPQPLRQPPPAVPLKRQASLGKSLLEDPIDPHGDAAATFLERTETPAERRSPKPSGPVVPQAVANSIDELRATLERTKRKLERSRQQEEALREDLQSKTARLADLQREAHRAEVERIKALERAAEKTKLAQSKKRALRGRRGVVANLDALGDEFDDGLAGGADAALEDLGDDRADDETARAGCAHCSHQLRVALRRLRRTASRALGSLWLLRGDVRWIQSRFGSSVAVYFVYTQYIVNLAVGNLLIWLSFHVISFVQYARGDAPSTGGPPLSGPLAYLPPALFRYSTYGGSPYGRYAHVSLVYGVSVMGYLVWYVVAALHRMSHEAQAQATRDALAPKQSLLFAQQLLTSWDVSTQSDAELRQHQHAALSNLRALLYETEWRGKVKARSREESRGLLVHQVAVVALHATLQAGVWAAIIFSQIHAGEIDRHVESATGSALAASFSSVVIYSTLIELMPLICPHFASACKWDNPKYTRMHKVVGYYAGYAIGLLVLGTSELGMMLMWLEATPSPSGANYSSSAGRFPSSLLYSLGRQPEAELYACGQDQLGAKFLQQALLGFVTPKLFELSTAAAHYWLQVRVRGGVWTKQPLKIEKKFVRNVYFQGLLWMAVPYLPLMTFVMPLMLLLEFQFDKRALVRLCSKETTPFQSDFAAFLVFHSITLAFFVAIWAYLFLRTDLATARCGPFFDTATATSVAASPYVQARLSHEAGDWVDDTIDYLLDNSYLLWLVILYLAYAGSDSAHRAARLQEASEDRTVVEAAERVQQAARSEHLEKEVKRWKRRCQELEKESHANGEAAVEM